MTNPTHTDPTVRHDALLLIEAVDSNPNGDPDAGNQPRTDPETGQGLITDVSIKRKIRDTIALQPPDLGPPRFGIYVTAGTALNTQHERAWKDLGDKANPAEAQKWMCSHYYDVRMFGAVMTTGQHTAGRVTGPLQVGIARSVDPVVPTELAITRVTKTVEGNEDQTEMGTKWIVPYGLYAARIHYSPAAGERTGVTEADLELLWNSLLTMWDHTRSAARTNITTRGLYVFTHNTALGNAPATTLLETISVGKKDPDTPARSIRDYEIALPDPANLPYGVTLTILDSPPDKPTPSE